MGDYINPKGMSKEEWLEKHGEILTVDQVITKVWSGPVDYMEQTTWVVCMVDNGMFTAAAIGTSQSEVRAFLQPDGREKLWLAVDRKLLEPFIAKPDPNYAV